MTRPATRNNRPNLAVIGTVIVVLVILIAAVVWQRTRPATASGPGQNFDLTGQPTLGPADAKVTVVTFEDFKCPNCQRYDADVYPQIKQNYIDTGKIRYVFVNFPLPLGEDSYTAAVAGECVYDQNPALFWPYKEVVFRGQKEETTTWATPTYLTELGGYVDGVDTTKLRSCIDANNNRARVDADRKIGDNANVNATPSVFVNGQLIQSASYDNVKAAIDKALQ